MTDYRKILIAMLDHFLTLEGALYLSSRDGLYGLSPEEFSELKRAVREIDPNYFL